MKLPTEMELFDGDTPFRVKFDYDPGERQWFNPSEGVGSPGYPPSVDIYEVNYGNGWEFVEDYPEFDNKKYEATVLERILEIEAEGR